MKVIKNYLYNTSYQILVILAPLITTPYVSRVLGARASGINSYTNGWVTFFCILGQLGVLLYGNREIAYHREDKKERSRVFWGIAALQFCTVTLALLAYIVVVFLFSSTFRLYYLLQTFWILAYGTDVSWYFMGMEDFRKTVVRNALVKFASIALIFIVVHQENDLWKYILILSVTQVLGNLAMWPYLRGQITWISPMQWKPLVHLYPSILLFIPTIATQIYTVVNKLMLGSIGTSNAVGQFTYADSIVKLTIAIVTSTGTVMLPHMAHLFSQKDYSGIRQSLYVSFEFETAVAIPIAMGLMAIGLKLAPWFLGKQYVTSGYVIFLEAPAIIFIAYDNVVGTQYLMPIKRVKEYTLSVIMGALVNILFNFILISEYSAKGAAIATVISELSIAMVQFYFVHSEFEWAKMFNGIGRYFVSGLAMFVIVFQMNSNMSMTAIHLLIQIVVGVVVYVVMLFIVRAPILNKAKKLMNRRSV